MPTTKSINDGQWTNAANWDNGVPQAGYDVVIQSHIYLGGTGHIVVPTIASLTVDASVNFGSEGVTQLSFSSDVNGGGGFHFDVTGDIRLTGEDFLAGFLDYSDTDGGIHFTVTCNRLIDEVGGATIIVSGGGAATTLEFEIAVDSGSSYAFIGTSGPCGIMLTLGFDLSLPAGRLILFTQQSAAAVNTFDTRSIDATGGYIRTTTESCFLDLSSVQSLSSDGTGPLFALATGTKLLLPGLSAGGDSASTGRIIGG